MRSDLKDVRFTEEMKGWFTPGAPAYEAGFHTGHENGTALGFRLTIGTRDLAVMRADPEHTAEAHGWVHCPVLGAGRLPVRRGTFNLFAPDPATGHLRMRYRLPFDDDAGAPYVLSGFKAVTHDRPLDAWSDTTTLFVKLLTGPDPVDDDRGAELGRGILHLDAPMFARQLLTLRGRPAAIARFGASFGAHLVREYARPVRSAS